LYQKWFGKKKKLLSSSFLINYFLRAFEDLQIKHEPLTLIKPQFEVPMPSLKPAVYSPIFRDCEPPSLELFDLEDYFASETSRLNQLTNKCSEQDLDLFIKEFGSIAGISSRMPTDQRGAKQILEFVTTQLFEFKRMYQPGVGI
jgi:intraflagellar transport protein 52